MPLSLEYHAEIVRQIIDFNLTSKQVKELCQGDTSGMSADDLLNKLPASAVKMARVAQMVSNTTAQDLARALIQQEGDAGIALARLQALRKLITETEGYLAPE